jgi:hypothetical protein
MALPWRSTRSTRKGDAVGYTLELMRMDDGTCSRRKNYALLEDIVMIGNNLGIARSIMGERSNECASGSPGDGEPDSSGTRIL